MAKPKPIYIDGEYREVRPKRHALLTWYRPEVRSVGKTQEGALIPRSEFTRVPVPNGFQTNLSAINKGAGGSVRLRPRNLLACSPLLQKCGAHLRSSKTGRQQARLEIQKEKSRRGRWPIPSTRLAIKHDAMLAKSLVMERARWRRWA